MDYFSEAAAMPAFATLAGVRDRALTSPTALWRLSLRTLILLGGALLVAHYSPIAERAWWFYRYMVFAPNKGVLKAPSREFFRMHAWFMVALPAWRFSHALVRSVAGRGVCAKALPVLGLAVHLGCWGNNCRWPFVRHPHDFEASEAAEGYFADWPGLRALASALPQNDISVIAPYFIFYATLPALLPERFPHVLPSPGTPSSVGQQLLHLTQQLAARVRGLSTQPHQAYPPLRHPRHPSPHTTTSTSFDQRMLRSLWVSLLIMIFGVCCLAAASPQLHLQPGTSPSDDVAAVVMQSASLPPQPPPGATHSSSDTRCAVAAAATKAWLEAALYHTKRAYGCNGTVFPPRPLVVRTDAAAPCGMGRAGGWSPHALSLDLAGLALSSAAIVGIAAAVPRSVSSWTAAGEHTLSVYLLHLYVLPAIDLPLTGLVQAAAYFIHPEAALLTALLGCLLVVRSLAMPLPALSCSASRMCNRLLAVLPPLSFLDRYVRTSTMSWHPRNLWVALRLSGRMHGWCRHDHAATRAVPDELAERQPLVVNAAAAPRTPVTSYTCKWQYS